MVQRLDVIGYSSSDLDIVLKVDKLPSHDDKINGQLVGRLPGGTMANYACAASKLGLRAGWTGAIGDDEAGRIVLDGFLEYGVDTSSVQILDGKSTMFTVILIDGTGERAIVVVPTIQEPEKLSDRQKMSIANARLLYTAPYEHIPFLHAAQWARSQNTFVAIDVDLTTVHSKDRMDEVLSYTDVVVFNQSVLPELFGVTFQRTEDWASVADLLRGIVLKHRIRLAGLTLGSKGCLLVDAHSSCYCPGYRVKVVDTTGAGDCFNAALTMGVLNSWSLVETGVFANAAGAISVGSYGPRGHLPGFDEVRRLMEVNSPGGPELVKDYPPHRTSSL